MSSTKVSRLCPNLKTEGDELLANSRLGLVALKHHLLLVSVTSGLQLQLVLMALAG